MKRIILLAFMSLIFANFAFQVGSVNAADTASAAESSKKVDILGLAKNLFTNQTGGGISSCFNPEKLLNFSSKSKDEKTSKDKKSSSKDDKKADSLFGGGKSLRVCKQPDLTLGCQYEDGEPADNKYTCPIDDDDFKDYKLALDNLSCHYSCKQDKANTLRTEISCLQETMKQTAERIKSFESGMQQAIQQNQAYMGKVNDLMVVNETAKRNALEALNTNKDTEKKGLLAVEQEGRALLKELEGGAGSGDLQQTSVKGFQKQISDLRKTKRNFMKSQASKIAADANDCFTKPYGGLKCQPDGPVVSPKEYIVCMYQQKSGTYTSGEVAQKDSARSKSAKANAENLSKLLDDVSGYILTSPNVSVVTDESGVQKYGSTITNRITAKYGTALKAYGDSYGAVIQDFLTCYNSAYVTGWNKASDKDGELSKITDAENTVDGAMSEKLNQLQDSFNNIAKVYTGTWKPVSKQGDCVKDSTGKVVCPPSSFDDCLKAEPDTKISCINAFSKQLRSGLDGGTSTTVKYTFPGVKVLNSACVGKQAQLQTCITAMTQAPDYFTCTGISDCVVKVQNVVSQLDSQKVLFDTQKKGYTTQANQQIEKGITQVASSLNAQTQALKANITKLNQALALLGLKPLKTEQSKCEGFESDDNGLYKMPKDVMSTIGCKTVPPYESIGSEEISDMVGSMGSESSKNESKLAAIQKAFTKLKTEKEKCDKKGKEADEGLGKLEKKIKKEGFSDDNCEKDDDSKMASRKCPSIGKVGDLIKDWGDVFPDEDYKKNLEKFGEACADMVTSCSALGSQNSSPSKDPNGYYELSIGNRETEAGYFQINKVWACTNAKSETVIEVKKEEPVKVDPKAPKGKAGKKKKPVEPPKENKETKITKYTCAEGAELKNEKFCCVKVSKCEDARNYRIALDLNDRDTIMRACGASGGNYASCRTKCKTTVEAMEPFISSFDKKEAASEKDGAKKVK